jgi:hypothetical protein
MLTDDSLGEGENGFDPLFKGATDYASSCTSTIARNAARPAI